MFLMSFTFVSDCIAWKLSNCETAITSANEANIERPPPIDGSSQRVCHPPQPRETRAFGAWARMMPIASTYRSLRARQYALVYGLVFHALSVPAYGWNSVKSVT